MCLHAQLLMIMLLLALAYWIANVETISGLVVSRPNLDGIAGDGGTPALR